MGQPAGRRAGGEKGAPGRALSRARSARRARSGNHGSRVPRDGETLGEVMFRGNIVMKGYLKNKARRDAGLRRRLVSFRRSRRDASRRLCPAQGPLQGHHHFRRREYFLDRGRGRAFQASGGVSSPPWSPSPTTNGAKRRAPSSNSNPGRKATAEELIDLCRQASGRLQMPAPRRVRRTAENLDRQDSEIQAAGSGEADGLRSRRS